MSTPPYPFQAAIDRAAEALTEAIDTLQRQEDEIDLLRALIRKMERLMPGPRGREVLLTADEHEAYVRALEGES